MEADMAGSQVGIAHYLPGLPNAEAGNDDSTVSQSPKSTPAAGDGNLKISGEVAAKFDRMNKEFDRILESWADKLGIQHGELKTHLDRVRLAYEIASALQKSDPAGYQDFLKQVETAGAPFKVNLGLARSEGGERIALNSSLKLEGEHNDVNQKLLQQFNVAKTGTAALEQKTPQKESQTDRPEGAENVAFRENVQSMGDLLGGKQSLISSVLSSAASERSQEAKFLENLATNSPAGLLPAATLAAASEKRSAAEFVQHLASLDRPADAKTDSPAEATTVADKPSSSAQLDPKHLANAKDFIEDYDTNANHKLDSSEVDSLLERALTPDMKQLLESLQRHIAQTNGGKPITAEQLAAFMASVETQQRLPEQSTQA
jgi:hypothetical protein